MVLLGIILTLTPYTVAFGDSSIFSRLYKQKITNQILYESYLDKTHKAEEMIGFHSDTFLSDTLYFALAINGVIQGQNSGGYGIASCGLGYRLPLNDTIKIDTKILIGAGGGGGIQGGGGLMIEGLGGPSIKMGNNIDLNLKIGYLTFPSGQLHTWIFNIGLSYTYDKISIN